MPMPVRARSAAVQAESATRRKTVPVLLLPVRLMLSTVALINVILGHSIIQAQALVREWPMINIVLVILTMLAMATPSLATIEPPLLAWSGTVAPGPVLLAAYIALPALIVDLYALIL